MDLNKFEKLPVMGILRGVEDAHLEPLFETVISSGLEAVEITMNTPGASGLIRKAVKISRGRLAVGAGTVTDTKLLKSAVEAGASFIVSPVLVDGVVKFCVKNKIPVFPGALTPQEIFNAWEAGASMVKVFPAKFFGPEYCREIKGPFNGVKLLACGGVTPENIKDYISCGADAVAFGASVFRKEWLDNRDFLSMEKSIKRFLEPFRARI